MKADGRYLRAEGLDPDSCIYFDIETTGLKAETSHLYLIGYAVPDGGDMWKIVQLFAERTSQEEDVLKEFSSVCRKYRTVVHFNGDRFDIPYLEEKYREFDMVSPFADMETFDIYRQVKAVKKLLALDRIGQKAIERFLGIRRKDPYDGGQLIEVYRLVRDRLSDDPEADRAKLMLHNYEDVLGMFPLTEMVAYPLAFEAAERLFDPHSGEAGAIKAMVRRLPLTLNGEGFPGELRLTFRLPVPVPASLERENGQIRVFMKDDLCEVGVPVREDTLRHYFADYKNYYYLPQEDRAVHRSVAQFVDKDHKVKAKADTCYVKKTSRFIPVPQKAAFDREKIPVFHTFRKEKTDWVELTDELEKELCGHGAAAAFYVRVLMECFRTFK